MTMELPAIARIAAALVAALLISFIATPVVKSIAQMVGAVDVPKDHRRMHNHPIPRMGGLAIFLGFLLSTLIFVPMSSSMRGMLLGGVIIVILGIFDDIYALPALPKLLVQIAAALVAVLHGNVIQVLSNPNIFSENPYWTLGSLAVPLSVIWIVAITNAVNLIDGLDGLAVGVATISSLTMLVIAMLVSENVVALMMAALYGYARRGQWQAVACLLVMLAYGYMESQVTHLTSDPALLLLCGAVFALPRERWLDE